MSFNAGFYGGSGDDYFEVNHNVGELQLFGESGDDTFFLKAQLQESGSELSGGTIHGRSPLVTTRTRSKKKTKMY